MKYDEYNWKAIQAAYDAGCSYKDLTSEFGCASATIQKAGKSGLFVSRDKNALRIASGRKYVLRRIDGKCRVCKNTVLSKTAAYCSNSCYAQERRDRYIIRWKNGDESGTSPGGEMHTFLRSLMLEEANDSCSVKECQFRAYNPWTGRPIVQIDHIDGDSGNNAYANLRVLCPNCHAMTPNFGKLNLGKGRHNRRMQRAIQSEKVRKTSLLVVMKRSKR